MFAKDSDEPRRVIVAFNRKTLAITGNHLEPRRTGGSRPSRTATIMDKHAVWSPGQRSGLRRQAFRFRTLTLTGPRRPLLTVTASSAVAVPFGGSTAMRYSRESFEYR